MSWEVDLEDEDIFMLGFLIFQFSWNVFAVYSLDKAKFKEIVEILAQLMNENNS